MCDPITITTLMVVSGAYQAYSQYQQGSAQKKYYDAQADANTRQGEEIEKAANKQSGLIQDKAARDMARQKTQAQALSSSQRAALAANGIDLSSVTALDIASDTIAKSKMDEMALRFNSDVQSWQVTEDAKYKNWALQTQAEQMRGAGRMAKQAGKQQAVGTLLSTAASVAMVNSSFLTPNTTTTTASTNPFSLQGSIPARQPAGFF